MNGALTVGGTLTLTSGPLTIGANTLTLDGLVTTTSGTLVGGGTSNIVIGGTAAQLTLPAVELNNLTLNRTNGAALGGNVGVGGTLTLTNGLLTLGSNNLTLAAAAAIGGTPGAANMVVPTGTGQMRKTFTGTGSFTYPVGDNTGTAEYSPITLNFTAGTFGATPYAGVTLADAKHPDNPSLADYLTRYWSVSQNDITGFTCNITGTYVPEDTTGLESNMFTGKWNGTRWTRFGAVNPVTHQISAAGVTSFSEFTAGSEYLMNAQVVVKAKAFMQGPWDGASAMNTYLIPDPTDTTTVMLPLDHPYGGATAYGGGYNGAVSHMGSENIKSYEWFNMHPTVVDWIMVEVRNVDQVTTEQTRAALLLSDGSIVDLDGASPVAFDSISAGGHYIVLRHRNHLAIMSADTTHLYINSSQFNFTNNILNIFGNDAKDLTGTGVYGMYSGDGNSDGGIDFMDRVDVWLTDNGGAGYLYGDFNLDGGCDFTDRVSYWLPNNGGATQVP
jgi:hypothetical protein